MALDAAEPAALDHNAPFTEERRDLAAAFRWAARHNWHEAVANHFSLAVSEDGSQFLCNPCNRHFSLMKASELLLIDANDPSTMEGPNAPDPTTWGLHGALHRRVPHARCAMHVHSKYATVLACLEDPALPPIDQNSAVFFNRVVIDTNYGGLAFEEEGERCAALFSDPRCKVMVMGNHGIMVIGETVAETFDRLYYFERAAENYVTALMTGRPLSVLSDEVAESVASGIEQYPVEQSANHLRELREILDKEGDDYAT